MGRGRPALVSRNHAVVEAYKSGKHLRAVGAEFGITPQRAGQILHAHKQKTGEALARPRGRPSRLRDHWGRG